MSEEEKNVYKSLFEYPTKIIAGLEKENQQLKEQYSKLEEKYLKQVPCCNEYDCELYRELQQKRDVIDEALKHIRESRFKENNGCGYECEAIINDYNCNDIDKLVDILEKVKGDNK